MSDFINIHQLEVFASIGIYAKEQRSKQRLAVTLQLRVQSIRSAAKSDNVGQTVNYAKVCETVKRVASQRPRKLIETLAEETASAILKLHPVEEVTVEIEKFILPDARSVSVKISRKAVRKKTRLAGVLLKQRFSPQELT